jgi:hypothetical protein
VAVRSQVCATLNPSNSVVVGLNPSRGVYICLRFSLVRRPLLIEICGVGGGHLIGGANKMSKLTPWNRIFLQKLM